MLTATARYKAALHGPHKRRTRMDVVDADGTVLLSDVPIADGSVTANLTNRVTRSAQFVTAADADRLRDLPGGLFPDDDTDPMSPAQAIVRIRSGIEYADGSSELFPLIVGRIDTATLNPDGSFTCRVYDRAQDVVDFRFENPRNSDSSTVLGQIETLVSEAIPGVVFGPHNVANANTPQLTWDEDRGQAVDDLAEALGGRWYLLGDGSCVVRSFPYDDGTWVQEIEDGPQGLMSQATISRSRGGLANSVTVVSERTDGTEPVRVRARNTAPDSPTAYGDRFGRVTQIIKIQTPLTNSEAQRLARAQLNASSALVEQWSFSCVPDHSLEPGDPLRLGYRGRRAVQVADSITYPLGLGDMRITGRAYSTLPVTLSV